MWVGSQWKVHRRIRHKTLYNQTPILLVPFTESLNVIDYNKLILISLLFSHRMIEQFGRDLKDHPSPTRFQSSSFQVLLSVNALISVPNADNWNLQWCCLSPQLEFGQPTGQTAQGRGELPCMAQGCPHQTGNDPWSVFDLLLQCLVQLTNMLVVQPEQWCWGEECQNAFFPPQEESPVSQILWQMFHFLEQASFCLSTLQQKEGGKDQSFEAVSAFSLNAEAEKGWSYKPDVRCMESVENVHSYRASVEQQEVCWWHLVLVTSDICSTWVCLAATRLICSYYKSHKTCLKITE